MNTYCVLGPGEHHQSYMNTCCVLGPGEHTSIANTNETLVSTISHSGKVQEGVSDRVDYLCSCVHPVSGSWELTPNHTSCRHGLKSHHWGFRLLGKESGVF